MKTFLAAVILTGLVGCAEAVKPPAATPTTNATPIYRPGPWDVIPLTPTASYGFDAMLIDHETGRTWIHFGSDARDEWSLMKSAPPSR